MTRPSPNVLANLCRVYPFVPAQDADGGLDPARSFPAGSDPLPCSYQCDTAERVDAAGRVSTVNRWSVLFATEDLLALPAPVKVNDRLDLFAADGVTVFQSVYADGGFDYAGRGAASEVPCRDVF
jgi:hypothetical protein